MKKGVIQKLTFVSKSLLWSLLLYFVSMALINWDEVIMGFRKNAADNVAAVHIIPHSGGQGTASIDADNNIAQPGAGNETSDKSGNVMAVTGKILRQLSKITGVIPR